MNDEIKVSAVVASTTKVKLASSTRLFPVGSAEEKLYTLTRMPTKILLYSHPNFSMRFEGENLLFDLNMNMQDNLSYNDIINENVNTVSYIDIMISPINRNSFDWVYMNARNVTTPLFSISEDESEINLLCFFCKEYFTFLYSNMNSIDDITRPLPIQIFCMILSKCKDLEIAYVDSEGNDFAGTIYRVSIMKSMFSQHICLELNIVSKSKEGFFSSIEQIELPFIPLASKVEDLGIVILTPELKDKYIARGNKYIEYTEKPLYKQYEGFAFGYDSWQGNIRHFVNSRVMIDAVAMRTLNSSIDDCWYIGKVFDSPRNRRGSSASANISEDKVWMLSPVVYGFSFVNKVWLRFSVDQFSPIEFSDTSLDNLIVSDEYKEIFISCLSGDMPSLDTIEGKGKGRIFLLYGPPGTGKTLSAESVAEYLHRPIYYVSVGELGTSPREMEDKLSNVMAISSSWDAVILLDEVDVFAMKREGADIERTAMTAILLRLLERYNGVMFMTTNLVKDLDPAFISRATVCMEYPALDIHNRKLIWKNLLYKASKCNLDIDEDVHNGIDILARAQLNGREIKNLVRLGYSMAKYSKDKKLTMKILSSVMSLTNPTV